MDVWGAGCVLFEITSLFPLFPGADEVDQINRIHKVVGTPEKELLIKLRKVKSAKMDFKFREQAGVGIRHFIPHASIECINLLNRTLEYDYARRISSGAACEHEYFGSLRVNRKSSNKATGSSSPTSVRNLRDEKATHRQRGHDKKKTDVKASQRIIKAKKIESKNSVKVRI